MQIVVALLLLLGIALSSCGRREEGPTATEPMENDVLRVPLRENIATFDPANAYDTISIEVISQSLEQLYQYHYLDRPYRLEPLLAKGMPRIDKGGTRYTIELKRGIRYHDDPAFGGRIRHLQAIDFVHQIKRIALTTTKSNGWFLFKGLIVGLDDFRERAKHYRDILKLPVSGLQTSADQGTLTVQLTRPFPQFQYVLAMTFSTPVPYEAIRHYQNNLNEHMVGTGPFQLLQWKRNHSVTMVKNPHYRHSTYPAQGDEEARARGMLADAGKALPFLSRIEFTLLAEAQTRWLNFLSGKIDTILIPKDNFNTAITAQGELSPALTAKDIVLDIAPTLYHFWVSFNMNHPILGKNRKLRQAIAHAIDVDKYIALFTNNVGQRSHSIFVPGIRGHDPQTRASFRYDLQRAKQLLQEAGYPGGSGLPRFTYDVRGQATFNRQHGEFIKMALQQIGLQIDVISNTFPGFLKKLREGKLQIFNDGWGLDYPDAENAALLLHSDNHPPGPNAASYNNPEVDRLIDELKLLPDGEKKICPDEGDRSVGRSGSPLDPALLSPGIPAHQRGYQESAQVVPAPWAL